MGFFKKIRGGGLEVVNRQLRGVANEPRRQWRRGFAADDAGKTGKDSSAAETVRLRTRLLRELGVASLEAIPLEGSAERRAIRALGYF